LVNNMEGMDRIYKLIRERVPKYVDRAELSLLVRLLTGIQKYREMQYIFDELIKYDMFELILRKAMDKDGQWELKLALRDYLLKNHPDDTERLNMVYFHFNMFREIGETLSETAHTTLKAACQAASNGGSANVWEVTAVIYDQFLRLIQLFNEAAESFTKEDCCRAAHKCLAMSRLVSLQLQIPQIRLVGLNPQELKKLFNTHPSFSDTYVVAEAYEITNLNDWANPVFHHVVLTGNFSYFERFRKLYPVTIPFFQELVGRFRTEAPSLQRQPHFTNFQKLLEFCPDKIMIYRLCKEFKFPELADKIAILFPGVEELV